MRITAERLAELKAKGMQVLGEAGGQANPTPAVQVSKPAFGKWGHKFNAKRVERDGIKFPSEAEAAYYDHLKIEQDQGRVIFFLRQVPFYLPGGVKFVLDFLVFKADGTCDLDEVKGMATPEFKMKKKLVEASFPVKIRCLSYQKRSKMPSYFKEFEP